MNVVRVLVICLTGRQSDRRAACYPHRDRSFKDIYENVSVVPVGGRSLAWCEVDFEDHHFLIFRERGKSLLQ